MRKTATRLHVMFPASRTAAEEGIIPSIMERLRKSGAIEVAGYLRDEDLERDLASHIGTFDPARYETLTVREKREISAACESSIRRCVNTLPHELPIQIFLFPWFPDARVEAQFGGVNAVAVHEQVVHLFIVPGAYTTTSLTETIAHEFTHLAYYHAHPARTYSLGAHILMEGVAEVFREEIFGGKHAPWVTALSEKEITRALADLRPKLSSRSARLREQVLFGGGAYKPWTGYAVGYKIVKAARKQWWSLPWSEFIQKGYPFYFKD